MLGLFNFLRRVIFHESKEQQEWDAIDIDAVITHVDSNDPIWRRERAMYAPNPATSTVNDIQGWRWESNDEAKYCITSMMMFAPWIRRIFLVVAYESQIPCWYAEMKRKCPKLNVVFHHDFYEKPDEDLPTFNSTSIEANLHRIPGLAEHFLYFNDDCFLGAPVTKGHFLGKITTELYGTLPRGFPSVEDTGYLAACKNVNRMLDHMFPNAVGDQRPLLRHAPQLQLKSVHIELRQKFPEEFRRTSASRFRSVCIHNTTAGLAEYVMVYTGKAKINNNETRYSQFFLTDSRDHNRKAFMYLLAQRPHFFNLQNAMRHQDPKAAADFKRFIEMYFFTH